MPLRKSLSWPSIRPQPATVMHERADPAKRDAHIEREPPSRVPGLACRPIGPDGPRQRNAQKARARDLDAEAAPVGDQPEVQRDGAEPFHQAPRRSGRLLDAGETPPGEVARPDLP